MSSRNGWVRNLDYERVAHARMKRAIQANVADMPEGFLPEAYTKEADGWDTGLAAMVGREPLGKNFDDFRWHISVRGPDRVPTWEELVDAAHSVRPGVWFVIGMPPRNYWLNINEHVLHLYELKDANLLANWKEQGEAVRHMKIGKDRPT